MPATVYDVKTNRMVNPIGVDSKKPAFSWKIKSNKNGLVQKSYAITVKDENGSEVWNSGEVLSDVSLNIRYEGKALKPSARYAWDLLLTLSDGTKARYEGATFETGLLSASPLSDAKWIGSSTNTDSQKPVAFRKVFSVKKAKLVKAKLYSTALGNYENFMNGERVGLKDKNGYVYYQELKPGFTEANKKIFYNSYDITDYLRNGQNVISAIVTNGWWSGRVGKYGKENAYKAKVVLFYNDGSKEVIATGLDWKCSCDIAYRFADIFDGETYDARISNKWKYIGFNDSKWDKVKKNTEFTGKLESWIGSYITAQKDAELSVEEAWIYDGVTDASEEAFGKINVVEDNLKGNFTLLPGQKAVVDFGNNHSGREQICVSGKKGTVITIEHGETLNDCNGLKSRGNDGPERSIYNLNYRSAKATTNYILSGSECECYSPTFTFYGYRYLEISVSAPVEFKDIKGIVISSVEEIIGKMTTSNEKLNKLLSNIKWGQYSNYLSIPTDCPQRDERQGWTADTQVFAEAGCYIGNSETFLHKFSIDLAETQNEEGAYSGTAPRGEYDGAGWGCTGWADAGIIVPYYLYTMYGDKEIIEKNWDSMEKYVVGFLGKLGKRGPVNRWGDWLAYESNDAEIQDILAVAYYAWDALLMKIMAAAIGKNDRIDLYQKIYDTEKQYFIEKYVDEKGKVKRGEQSICLYALYLDLLPDEKSVKAVIKQLTSNIARNGNRLQTGFLGTKIILNTLTKIGRNDLAYSILLQEANPSWLYSVNQGATTIWERWNSYTLDKGFGDVGMNSFNHYAYGAVAAWMFRVMAGINVDVDVPAFKHSIIAPYPDERIKKVDASYESAYGKIEVSSTFRGGKWTYKVKIPANTSAIVILPLDAFELVSVNKKESKKVKMDTDCTEMVYRDRKCVKFAVSAASAEFVLNKK